MRHEKPAKLIELARELANSRLGLTLDEMAERIGVKRRTIERMRDRILELFDGVEVISDPPLKRWRINGRLDGFLKAPTTFELATLKNVQEHFESINPDAAGALKGLEAKMLSAVGPNLSRLETDIEAIMEAEAIAFSPGPRPIIDRLVLSSIREAILSLKMVAFNYAGGSKPAKIREINPYGILFGGENYLVGFEPEGKNKDVLKPRLWRIDRISNLKVLPKIGGPPEEFSLREFSRRSFGVFQEEKTYEVQLLGKAEFADELNSWRFHPSQKISLKENGDLLIEMKGGGLRELAWNLFRWGGKIQILSPPELKEEFKIALQAATNLA